ncbi:MAG: CatB-related O-acetyltransferase [Sphingopyxis sp.]
MTSASLRHYFSTQYNIDVGRYSYGCFDRWRMPGPMTIGRYCSFANSVRVVDANHPMDGITTHPIIYDASLGVVPQDRIHAPRLMIGDDVWVGHNVVILPGCKSIGRGAIIGAGSIVTGDVAPYTIMVGNPARAIRTRFDDAMIAAIEASTWWMMDADALAMAERSGNTITQPTLAALARLRDGHEAGNGASAV